jgi:two-component system response regulator (stage 0 sporulation protein A)
MERLIRIFLADASPDCIQLLRAALEQEEDMAVVGAATRGDEALERFPASGADVLLTDLLLPGLDGLSLLRRLKTAGALPHAIVLSGFFNDRIAHAVSYTADNYLLKPCRAEDLLRHIRACVLGGADTPVRNDGAAVTQALIACGVLPHLDGFRYLRDGLLAILADRSLLRGVTKILYRDVARRFGTTAECVERSCRSAIERAWQQKSPDARRQVFGPLFDAWQDKAPSNVPFLTAMTEYIENRWDSAGSLE